MSSLLQVQVSTVGRFVIVRRRHIGPLDISELEVRRASGRWDDQQGGGYSGWEMKQASSREWIAA